jgi:hypothetical protein
LIAKPRPPMFLIASLADTFSSLVAPLVKSAQGWEDSHYVTVRQCRILRGVPPVEQECVRIR